MDCIEAANFAGQPQSEIDRLLSFVSESWFACRQWKGLLTAPFGMQVVVGGGPTGVEYAGELHDFLKEDLGNVRLAAPLIADPHIDMSWLTVVPGARRQDQHHLDRSAAERSPHVLQAAHVRVPCDLAAWRARWRKFNSSILTKPSRTTSDYTMDSFKENRIDIATKTMVKEVQEKVVVAQNEKKELVEYPYGLLVW
jgi:NADH:ubiquinone reductase (non-electrogenic)